MSKSFKVFLVVVLFALAGFLSWRFFFNATGPTTAVPTPTEVEPPSETETPPEAETQPEVEAPAKVEAPPSGNAADNPVATPNLETFAEAVRNATSAAESTQIAQTPEEWANIGVQWDNAMQLMMKVPADHEQYAIAQDRIPTYQTNRDYAFTNAGLLE